MWSAKRFSSLFRFVIPTTCNWYTLTDNEKKYYSKTCYKIILQYKTKWFVKCYLFKKMPIHSPQACFNIFLLHSPHTSFAVQKIWNLIACILTERRTSLALSTNQTLLLKTSHLHIILFFYFSHSAYSIKSTNLSLHHRHVHHLNQSLSASGFFVCLH